MANEHMIAQVRSGMVVHTADGQPVGKVTQVWVGTDPTASSLRCDDERCSRLEVQRGRLLTRQVRYVPISAISAIATDQVTLNVEAAAVDEHDWRRTPQWITAVTASADDKNEKIKTMTLGHGG